LATAELGEAKEAAFNRVSFTHHRMGIVSNPSNQALKNVAIAWARYEFKVIKNTLSAIE